MKKLISLLLLAAPLTVQAAIDYTEYVANLTVATNLWSYNVIVTNGVTLGGVQRTTWPSAGGDTIWTNSRVIIFTGAPIYGVGDGSTDNYQALTNAIQLLSTNGGTIYFPPGSYVVTKTITLPNNNNPTWPTQQPLRLLGSGAGNTLGGSGAMSVTPSSELLLRSSEAPAKIVTLASGLLEIDSLQLRDDSDGTRPFILDTGTILKIHNCEFIGKGGSQPMQQDAIILGGTAASGGSLSTNDQFWGYGTIIDGNLFYSLQRALFLRSAANAVVFHNNTVWQSCGGYAAVEINPGNSSVGYRPRGNSIKDNLFEASNYQNVFVLTNSDWNTFSGNTFYDGSATNQAIFRLDSSTNNIITDAGFDIPPATPFTGSSVMENSFLGGFAGTGSGDFTSRGHNGSFLPRGLTVQGSWNSAHTYPGALTVTDGTTNQLSMAYSTSDDSAQMDVSHGTKNLEVNAAKLNALNGFTSGTNTGVSTSLTFYTTNLVGSPITNWMTISGGIVSALEHCPLDAPSNVSASTNGQTVNIVWTNAEGCAGYLIKRGTTTGGPYTNLATTTNPYYTDSAALLDVTNFYVVSATNTHCVGTASSEVEGYIGSSPFYPTNISNMAWFLSYKDLPASSGLWYWTNQVNTAQRASSSTGFTVDSEGVQGYTSSFSFSCSVTNGYSLWVVLKNLTNSGSYASVIINSSVAAGLYIRSSQLNFADFTSGGGNDHYFGNTLSGWYDVVWANGSTYTNNVAAASAGSYSGNYTTLNQILSSTSAKVKYIGIWTNTVLTAGNVNSLYQWSQANP